jgi:AcrR family transcriptional regulator
MARSDTSPNDTSGRDRIVAAARQHFFAHGFRGVTMDDLAAELGMSKKTHYAHFPSKLALVEAVVREKFQALDGELKTVDAEYAADFPAALRHLLACVQRHTEEVRPPFLRDVQRETPSLFQQIDRRRRELIRRHFGKLFTEGQKAGTIRKDISADLILEVLLTCVREIVNPDRLLEINLTPQTAFGAILSVVLEGVLTDKGRAKR